MCFPRGSAAATRDTAKHVHRRPTHSACGSGSRNVAIVGPGLFADQVGNPLKQSVETPHIITRRTLPGADNSGSAFVPRKWTIYINRRLEHDVAGARTKGGKVLLVQIP